MSKWTEVRDGFVSALDVNDVVDTAKKSDFRQPSRRRHGSD